ncbi:hypothetical protein SAMN05421805_10747 [Saccharopolyspora antimicrobica]|uniref:Acyl carrier protein n=1 Tax=Saccharopolyspora antimicrobica TaxID=455193 RepID=A0A1I5C340_9PSEU|nr:hypothetical protein [Saccharopolyspora antimicrobica]RKT88988.1 hypothetical protein ATL45_7434 [Saccharopolyspora antimicrobica]SFN81347.1 hypothetical protein SAMN05421805_10747 [Saccharopolyspora antimicrobica]
MISRAEFIRIVREELRLPLADPDLEHAFDQEVNWRSIHRVRLFAAVEQLTGVRASVDRLFEEQTASGIYAVFAEASRDDRAEHTAAGSGEKREA